MHISEEWCLLFYFISFIFIIFSYNPVSSSDPSHAAWVICSLTKPKIYAKNIRKNELQKANFISDRDWEFCQ